MTGRFWSGRGEFFSFLMSYTIFVRNISYSASNQDLGTAFEQYGKVTKAIILTERIRGERVSRGIGFVTFETEAQRDAAIAANGKVQIKDRKLSIQKAREQQPKVTAFIANIATGTTKENVLEAFKAYNPADARVVRTMVEGEKARKGFGFVKFATAADLDNCVKNNQTIKINGVDAFVRIARRPFDAQPRRRPYGRRPYRRNIRKAATE